MKKYSIYTLYSRIRVGLFSWLFALCVPYNVGGANQNTSNILAINELKDNKVQKMVNIMVHV